MSVRSDTERYLEMFSTMANGALAARSKTLTVVFLFGLLMIIFLLGAITEVRSAYKIEHNRLRLQARCTLLSCPGLLESVWVKRSRMRWALDEPYAYCGLAVLPA
jgi:hypothetical protein